MYYLHPKRKKSELYKLLAIYLAMVIAVIGIFTFVMLFIMGYRIDINKGKVERYALLQLNSSPSNAIVTVDGKVTDVKTPGKYSLPAGSHKITMWREGYEVWQKTVVVDSGELMWLNYALLIPEKITVEPVMDYSSISSSIASPDGRSMLISRASGSPIFDLMGLSSDSIKASELQLPSGSYDNIFTSGITHVFKLDSWDINSRYVLISHSYDNKLEWIVLDTQNISSTKNINKLLNLNFSQVYFSGTSGNLLYGLDPSGSIRKIDLSSATISKALVNNVENFSVFKNDIITYTSTNGDKQSVGIYRDGDDRPYELRSVSKSDNLKLKISFARYFNENYVIISSGKTLDILSGSYPNTASGDSTSLKVTESFTTDGDIDKISFSPSGEYVLAQSGSIFTSYDLEYKNLNSFTVDGANLNSVKWLDNTHVWYNQDNNLTVREFDGANEHQINPAMIGQDITMTHNGRYIYSIGKTDTGYQLQRVNMILP